VIPQSAERFGNSACIRSWRRLRVVPRSVLKQVEESSEGSFDVRLGPVFFVASIQASVKSEAALKRKQSICPTQVVTTLRLWTSTDIQSATFQA